MINERLCPLIFPASAIPFSVAPCSQLTPALCTPVRYFLASKTRFFRTHLFMGILLRRLAIILSTPICFITGMHHVRTSCMDLDSRCNLVAVIGQLAGHCRQNTSQIPDIFWLTSEWGCYLRLCSDIQPLLPPMC